MLARRLRVVVPLLFVVLLAACDWGQFGFDAGHSGFDPVEPGLTVDNVGTLTPRWSTAGAAPAVAGTTVYHIGGAADAAVLDARDAATGAVKWHTALPANRDVSDPSVAAGIVYVTVWDFHTGIDAQLNAFDATSGAPRWSTPLDCGSPDILHSPAVASGIVAVGQSGPGRICALDASTGAKAWTKNVPTFASGIAIAGGRVYFSAETSLQSGVVGALAAADGSVVWTRSLNVAPGTDPPVVGGGRVYVSGSGSLVFDAATGSPQPSVPLSNLSAGPGILVGTTGGSGIAAVDASTGATRWSIVGPAGTIYGKPAIANGVVYVGSHQEIGDPRVPGGCCAHMAALNLGTGGLLFSFPTQASGGIPTPTSVIVSNGAAYVNAQGNLTALRPAGA